jgi:hypothetical protein
LVTTVAEAVLADAVVADPGVGPDLAGALEVSEHEVGQEVLAGVDDALHPHAPGATLADLDGDRHECLAGARDCPGFCV